MKNFLKMTFALALASAMCMSFAQQGGGFGGGRGQGQGQGQGQGRGQGRQGMMMGRQGGVQSKLQLVMRNDVQTDLKMTDEQKTQVAEQSKNMQTEMQTMMQGMQGGGGNMQQMRDQMTALMKKSDAEVDKILDDAQDKRLKEIQVQLAGIRIITEKEYQGLLGFTQQQTLKVKTITDDQQNLRQDMMERMRNGELDRNSMGTEMEKMQKDQDAKLLAVLTDEQKALLDKMKGEPFKADANQGRQGFGGPGGGGVRPGN